MANLITHHPHQRMYGPYRSHHVHVLAALLFAIVVVVATLAMRDYRAPATPGYDTNLPAAPAP